MKAFKYHIIIPLLLWVLIVFGTYLSDQKQINACTRSGKFFEYSHFRCLSEEPKNDISYYKARYSIFAGTSVAVLLYVGAVTVFFVMRELKKHN